MEENIKFINENIIIQEKKKKKNDDINEYFANYFYKNYDNNDRK